ncbi:hypothetical protein G4B88_018713 [Cannabis sativa]|uniref:non-specific serine/threonine protein kinase n=1 Tax=Cannabis sativa TaxID=3483 RepID=A0A7J6HZX9_CANSA|nr:hypothetical protein G4B88_018713 [Cannabis sativa]
MRGTNYGWLIIIFFFSLSPQNSIAQNATTDPSEVIALNTIFQKWNVKANPMWNMSGEPCTGSAINNTIDVEQEGNNPSIKCNCTYNNNTTCHITHLRVQSLDAHGVIPEEITALPYLFKIDLNYFSGTLPTFLGNLSALQILSVSHNAFSGPIPKELGNLKDLFMIALGSNNFSGTLPPELGNLPNLQLVAALIFCSYIDSCGLSGEIPSTFAKLQNMRVLYATDSPFSGKIPEFIGSWKNLTELRLVGNSFEGPIPASFSELTSLQSLRISDIYSGSSSLDFVRNLTNLNELILRNALISGKIPSYIEGFQSLKTLYVSIPKQSDQLKFLGNNSLSGILPSQLNDNIQNIDASYNHLSGSLPPWVITMSQLNLVANDFVFDSSNKSVLAGLECLQRDFPCNRNAAPYTNFSLKCGGPEVRGNTGIVYEAERLYLGPAKFYVIDERWAVSKVGLFADKRGKLDIEGNLAQVTGSTENPELFHTARMSPGSLRYYGLGLQNGPYTVTLHFAEIGFPNRNSQKWAGLARRMFDIYIQGSLRHKDFDIAKEAGGVEKALVKKFKVTVSENYLEIHLFWAGKGTCCIPKQGYYGPLIAAIHATSDFTPSGMRKSSQRGKNKTVLILAITIPAVVVFILLLFGVVYIRRKSNNGDDTAVLGSSHHLNTYSYAELRAATDDFNFSNKLGEGGFGHVHKGTLPDGKPEKAILELKGYLAPEYALRGHLTEKADVFAFGVLALEILSGRPNFCNGLENEKIYLLEWAWNLYEMNQSLELVDPTLTEFDENEATRLVRVALLCTQASLWLRPPMSRVIGMLLGDMEIEAITSKPSYLTDFDFKDTSTSVFSSDVDTSRDYSSKSM